MSKCISAKGEFSEHELDAKFTCVDCFAFDEDAALERIESLQAELAEARAVIEQVRGHAKSQRDKIRETYKSDLGYQEYANACDDVLDILDAAPSSAVDAACPNCSVKPARCCPIHGLHSMPHRGCFLR